MSVLKAALLQMEVQQEIPDSLARAEGLVRQAKEQGAQLALLPEMFCCPYQTPNFPVYAQPEGGEVCQALSRMAKEYGLYLGGSMPESDEAGLLRFSIPGAGAADGRPRGEGDPGPRRF